MNEASMLRYQLQNNTQKNRYTIRVTPYFSGDFYFFFTQT